MLLILYFFQRNDLVNVFQNLTLESVILIDGIVSLRPPGQENFVSIPKYFFF